MLGDHEAPVAVLPIPERGVGATLLGEYVADKLMVALAATGKVSLVERTRLDTLRQEHKLSSLGELDDATAANLGNLAGAKFVLVGTMTNMGGSWELTARLLGSNDGKIQTAVEAGFPHNAVPHGLAGVSTSNAVARLRSADAAMQRKSTGNSDANSPAPTDRSRFGMLGLRTAPPSKDECPALKTIALHNFYDDYTFDVSIRHSGSGDWTKLTGNGRLGKGAAYVCAPRVGDYEVEITSHMSDGDMVGKKVVPTKAGSYVSFDPQ